MLTYATSQPIKTLIKVKEVLESTWRAREALLEHPCKHDVEIFVLGPKWVFKTDTLDK